MMIQTAEAVIDYVERVRFLSEAPPNKSFHQHRSRNAKLGKGGIREIAQALQVFQSNAAINK